MIDGKKIVVVMPAYNAGSTLERTYRELPHEVIDEVVLVDDCSMDDTTEKAAALGIGHIIHHEKNSGYGANQKTCYSKALALDADVVVMVHPDYQYEPKLVTAMASLISCGVFDCVLGSRILGTGALRGGMPVYKFAANRFLTLFQNLLIPYKLSEYHTGFRAFSREVLQAIPLHENSDDFIFDNEMLLQIIGCGFEIGEVTCPTRYEPESSSINFGRSLVYGLSVLAATIEYRLCRIGLLKSPRFADLRRKGSA